LCGWAAFDAAQPSNTAGSTSGQRAAEKNPPTRCGLLPRRRAQARASCPSPAALHQSGGAGSQFVVVQGHRDLRLVAGDAAAGHEPAADLRARGGTGCSRFGGGAPERPRRGRGPTSTAQASTRARRGVGGAGQVASTPRATASGVTAGRDLTAVVSKLSLVPARRGRSRSLSVPFPLPLPPPTVGTSASQELAYWETLLPVSPLMVKITFVLGLGLIRRVSRW
jgi:hypothetical protein